MIRAYVIPVVSLVLIGIGATEARSQQTQEEIRFQGELNACQAQPEPQRKACIDAVRAKIRAAWTQRIEIESRRRQAP
jgi:hypothetical protein